jgi:zinc transport system substrate-binding protein
VVMVPPGASPHSYEPKPEQMRALARASAYFAIGVEYEKAVLPKIAAMHPDLKIVQTDAGIVKAPMTGRHQHGQAKEHEHEHEHEHGHHHHKGLDNHVWLAPELVRIQAKNILESLTALDPAHAAVYASNYRAFMADLDSLDVDIKEALGGREGSAFMVFHPAWGYFATQYGLRQIPVEVEGKEPTAQDLQRLIDRAKSEQIRVVFVSPQFSTRSAETIAKAINGQVVPVNPLAEDWMENMRTVAEKFRQAMQ